MKDLEVASTCQAWTDLEGLQGRPEEPMPLAATQEAPPLVPGRRPSPEETAHGRATDREIAARARDHTWT